MADNSTILEKLDGLVARFEEISTPVSYTHLQRHVCAHLDGVPAL